MFRRLPITVLAAGVVTAMTIGPAAAQSFDGEVLVAAPSADEVCALFEDLEDDLEGLEELAGEFEQLAGFDPQPVDDADYADLSDALQGVLDANEGAWGVSADLDGETLLVTIIPDLSDCDAVDEEDLMDTGLEPGTYLIQPTVDEYCAFIEDTFGDLEDEFDDDGFEDEDWDDDGFEDDDLGGLEGFFPEPVTGDELATYTPVADALLTLLEGAEDADEASATLADDTLLVALLPSLDRCDEVDDIIDDVADDVVDEDEEDMPVPSEVPSGVSPSSSSLPLVPALVLLLGAVLLAGGAVAHRRGA